MSAVDTDQRARQDTSAASPAGAPSPAKGDGRSGLPAAGAVPLQPAAPVGLHPTLAEALATFEALRRLRFSSDEIFVHYDEQAQQVAVLLRTFEGKQMAIEAGPYTGPEDAFAAAWQQAAALWNGDGMTDAERGAVCAGSRIRARGPEVGAALRAKGIKIPGAEASAQQRLS